jgi:hypothetical protein
MSSKITTNHDEIRRWAEARGGKPATVKSTQSNDEAGVLRIDFPGYSGAGSLQEISWEEFFKLVSRETASDKAHEAKSGEKKHGTH